MIKKIIQILLEQKMNKNNSVWKVSVFGVNLVRIFSVFSPNAGKYGSG